MTPEWKPHVGDVAPVRAGTLVYYHLAGEPREQVYGPTHAEDVAWGPGLGPEGQGRVDEFAVWVPR